MRFFMKFKTLTAAVLAAATAFSLTACGGDTSWTFRSGDYTVTSGMYVGLSIDAVNAAMPTEGYDTSKNPFSQDIEGSDAEKWIQSKANNLSKEYLAVETQFAERGLSLTEEDQTNIDYQVSMYWDTFGMGTAYEEEGCGKTSFTNLITNSYKKNLLFEAIYGEGGEKEVSEAELEAAYQEDYAKGVYISLSLLDSEGTKLTGDELEAVKNDAQKLADRINDGEDFETVKAEYLADPDAEEEDASEEPADTSVVFRKEDASAQPYTAILEGEIGKAQVVEDEETIYVVQALDVMSGDSFESYRSSILQEMKGEEFNEMVSEWANALTIEENSSAVSKHNPKHLKDLYQ